MDRRGALAAHHVGVHVVAACGVVELERAAFGAGEPAVAPRRHRGEDRVDVAALVGEPVLVANRTLLVLDTGEHSLVDEQGEVRREDVAPDAERALEVVEPAHAEARLAKQQQVPPVAQHVDGAGDRARPLRRVGACHIDNVSPV